MNFTTIVEKLKITPHFAFNLISCDIWPDEIEIDVFRISLGSWSSSLFYLYYDVSGLRQNYFSFLWFLKN